MTTLKVPFGLRDGRLYEPMQVDNGKRCSCDCPGCGRPLIARQNAQTPHFAHAPGEDCARGYETAIHLAAKQLIAERMEIALPALIWKEPLGWGARERQIELYAGSILAKLSNVRVEHWMDNIRPDLVATYRGGDLLIEIAVTHFVDPGKFAKIEALGRPAIELDISESKDAVGFAALEKLLFTTPSSGEWLFHPDLAARTERELAERKERHDFIVRAQIKEQEQIQAYRALAPEVKVRKHLKKTGMTIAQLKELSCFVPGEDSYIGGRLAWQSAVLAYIENRYQEMMEQASLPGYINSEDLKYWLRKVFEIKPRFDGAEGVAAWKYLEHLEKLGILKRAVSVARVFDIKKRPAAHSA